MAKKTITLHYVTRKILKEEISASEQRLGARINALDGKIETTTQSLKEYTGSRFNQLDAKIDSTSQSLKEYTDSRFNQLDAKIETTTQSLKEYTDSRFNQLDVKIETTTQSLKDYTDSRFTQLDTRFGDFDSKVNTLDAKMTKYFELMMQAFTEGNKGIHKILSSHEERIFILEGRGPLPGRI